MPLQLPIPNDPLPARPRRAFTLIELLVVMTIIVIMATISIPAIKTLTNGNNQKQATNLITTLIAAAHANALQSHTYAGIVFYEDPNHAGQTNVQLIQGTTVTYSTAGPNLNFIRQPRTGGQPLVRGVIVATLDDPTASSGGVNSADGGTPQTRVILFDPNGQLTLHGNLAVDPSIIITGANADKSAAAWILTKGASAPGLFIYDQQALVSAKETNRVTNQATYAVWVQSNADALIINPYTGNLIR